MRWRTKVFLIFNRICQWLICLQNFCLSLKFILYWEFIAFFFSFCSMRKQYCRSFNFCFPFKSFNTSSFFQIYVSYCEFRSFQQHSVKLSHLVMVPKYIFISLSRMSFLKDLFFHHRYHLVQTKTNHHKNCHYQS